MFQVSNPLRFYAQNPNLDDTFDADGAGADVPNLYESQQRLKRYNKITNYIIYGCAIFLLLILILTIAITLWKSHQEGVSTIEEDEIVTPVTVDTEEIHIHVIEEHIEKDIIQIPEEDITIEIIDEIKRETDIIVKDTDESNLCAECLDYNEIVRLAEENPRYAETYITTKVAETTSLDLDNKDDEKIAAMENFIDRMAPIPRARDEINRFITLNRTFDLDLSEAEKKEKETHQLRAQYEIKVHDIGNLTVKALTNIGETGDMKKQKDKLEDELRKTRTKLNMNIDDLETQKFNLEEEIRKARNQLADLLKAGGVLSEADVTGRISAQRDIINAKNKEITRCENKITASNTEIRRLTIEIRVLEDQLENTKLQLTQYQWVHHIMQTIQKFEDVRKQVRELLETQLLDGKDSFNRLVHSLETKEKDYLSEVARAKNPTESRTETSSVGEYGTVKRTITYTSATNLAGNLKLYIEQEQRLLKTWALEQFKTLNVSTNEIRNLTTTIDHLRDRISSHSGEYEKQFQLVQSITTSITTAKKSMATSNEDIQENQDAIESARNHLAAAQTQLKLLNDLLASIKGGSGDLAKLEARLLALKGEIEKERQYLSAIERSLNERIGEKQNKLNSLDDSLKRITAELNGAIASDPQPSAVERLIGGYIAQVRKSNTEYETLLRHLEEITRILC